MRLVPAVTSVEMAAVDQAMVEDYGIDLIQMRSLLSIYFREAIARQRTRRPVCLAVGSWGPGREQASRGAVARRAH